MSKKKFSRSKQFFGVILCLFLLILAKLFYWQIIKSDQLIAQAQQQSQKSKTLCADRGKIYTADNFVLAANQNYYQLKAEKKTLNIKPKIIAQALAPILIDSDYRYLAEKDSVIKESAIKLLAEKLQEKIENGSNWILLENKLKENQKQNIEKLELAGLHFVSFIDRYYPEASMAAHLLGFVGKNQKGEPMGYFGIEGALDKELLGGQKKIFFKADAFGKQLLGQNYDAKVHRGRDVTLTIRRDVQFLAQTHLNHAIKQYAAKAGEIIIMQPATGKILAQATWPNYDAFYYPYFNNADFSNPSLANLYEPGSTFKILTVAASIDAGVISPDTQCDKCDGPRQIYSYTIRTWDDVYHPNITVTDALAKSDNIAMIFIAEKLGAKKFRQYLEKFGMGKKLDLDLQEDTDTIFPDKFGPVELATAAFGQGVSLNSYQLIRAVNVIAAQGKLINPTIVEKVFDPNNNKIIENKIQVKNQVISSNTAEIMTQMMVNAAEHGEAQWTASKKIKVAGKTGTSQIATKGGYAEDKTIASFIGFAPADKPKFIMLVKLIEPGTSPWAAETAAPLWYKVAEKLMLLL